VTYNPEFTIKQCKGLYYGNCEKQAIPTTTTTRIFEINTVFNANPTLAVADSFGDRCRSDTNRDATILPDLAPDRPSL
jgi:hypothetical protein